MITLTSSAFTRGKAIPARYTCDGANESPPLQWTSVPAGTKQLVLFALDLGGGPKNAILWAVAGISPSVHGVSAKAIPAGAVIGKNSQGKTAWGGICPAKGKPHSYVFLLYALRKSIGVSSGFDPRTVQKQLAGSTTGAGLLFGTYQR